MTPMADQDERLKVDAVITAAKAGELDNAIEVAKGEDKKPKRKAA